MALAAPASAQQTADRIWSGGPILTMNDKAMRAEAVAVADGKIIAVGKRSDVMKLKGPNTQLVDLKGQTLVPGFVDAHGHIVVGGLQALSANLLAPPDGKVQDIASLQQTLRDWVQKNAAAVEKIKVIIGFGYDNAQLKELRHPTKEELDAVSQDIPVLIVHQSGHLATVNSAMLKAMGYDASTKDPAGGVIQRKPGTTEPNGTLEETALFAAVPVVLSRVGPEGLKTFAREGAKLWARFGYTTAEEGRATPQIADLLKQVAAEGGFANDVNAYPDVLIDRAYIKANQSQTYTNRFRVAGAKLTIDGSPQGFTAWRDRPYYKPVGNYPAGLLRLCRGVGRGRHGRRPVGVRERHPGHHPLQWRARLRPADRRPPGGAGALPEGEGPAPRADPRPVPARGPARQLQGAGRHPFAVPDAHLLLGRLAPRPHRRPAGGHEHLADRLGAEARHDLLQPPRRAGRLPGFDARARRHRHPPRPRLGPHRRPRASGRRHHRLEGHDDLARLPPLRGEDEGQPGARQARRLRHPLEGSDGGRARPPSPTSRSPRRSRKARRSSGSSPARGPTAVCPTSPRCWWHSAGIAARSTMAARTTRCSG